MAFSNRVLTTTQTALWDKVQDTVLNSNVVATRIMTAPKKWTGRQIEKPVKTSKTLLPLCLVAWMYFLTHRLIPAKNGMGPFLCCNSSHSFID